MREFDEVGAVNGQIEKGEWGSGGGESEDYIGFVTLMRSS